MATQYVVQWRTRPLAFDSRPLLLLLVALCLLGGCKRDNPQQHPQASAPRVAGAWTGTGTDDAVGFYNMSMTLFQDGTTASGSFTMAGPVASVSGNVYVTFNGAAIHSVKLSRVSWTVASPSNAGRVCSGELISRNDTKMNNVSLSLHYTMTDCQGGTWAGGASLQKQAGTN